MTAKTSKIIFETHLPLNLLTRGKVRDIYVIDDHHLLIVTTDRLSAFDVIMPNPIPARGKVLNQLSAFWFELLADIIPHHMITTDIEKMGLSSQLLAEFGDELVGRTMLVRRTKPLPVECVARGYVAGSGWLDYLKTQSISGVSLPPGLIQCQKLQNPIFTPATKAAVGHDENISLSAVQDLVGVAVATKLQELTLKLFQRASQWAEAKGIIIADTKFEFGLWNNELIWIDEALTPDSSRFWSKEHYQPGKDQSSFDKQIVRNYLLSTGWNREPPPPELPLHIIEQTSEAYKEVFRRITGQDLNA
ncbi:MAG: phosphoribosylaminoimidazolesuccinocarboxamide synthase [Proteobacteria bacterium]|nr:phosphoribosylaminoimidazolesuccinocarboxamide synthase [Pseudomonadota bacterium]